MQAVSSVQSTTTRSVDSVPWGDPKPHESTRPWAGEYSHGIRTVDMHAMAMAKGARRTRHGYEVVEEAKVPAMEGGARMPQALLAAMPDRFVTVTAARKACRRCEILVDGETIRCGDGVKSGATIRWIRRSSNAPRPMCRPEPPETKLVEVAYEDDHLAVLVKPRGLPVQGRGKTTLQQLLPYLLEPAHVQGALHRPHHVHRLDMPTGGLLIAAKTQASIRQMGMLFHERQVQKRYRAVAIGSLEGEGTIDRPLRGQEAQTTYRVVKQQRVGNGSGWRTIVDVWPATGRYHQIRRHLASIGHPIVGDEEYCPRQMLDSSNGLFLWAAEVVFPHPITGATMALVSEPPACFHNDLHDAHDTKK